MTNGPKIRRRPEPIYIDDVQRELRAELDRLDAKKSPQTTILYRALILLLDRMSKLTIDVALLHNKLQPVLRELQEDQIDVADHRSGKKSDD